MSQWGQKRARKNASQVVREPAHRRADVDDFDKVLAALRSSLARAVSAEQKPTGGTEPVGSDRQE